MKKINIAKFVNPRFGFLFKNSTLYSDVVLSGGRASTKSSAVSMMLVTFFLTDSSANVAIFRKVANTLRLSVYEQIKWAINQIGMESRFIFKMNPMQIIDKVTGTGFYFFGVDDPMKLKSAKISKGYVRWLWFEETAEFKDWTEIDTVRLTYTREKLPNGLKVQTVYSFNPPRNPYAWVNGWAEKQKTIEGWKVDHSTYLDDKRGFLSQQYLDDIERYKANDNEYYRWQFLGEAVGLGNNVYNMDMFHPITELFEDDPLITVAYSLDGGHAQSATTVLLFGITAKRKVILLDTMYYSPAGKSHKLAPSQLSKRVHDFIQQQLKDRRWGRLPIEKRTIDSAEAALRNQYINDYDIAWHRVAKKTKQIMIDNVHSLLAEGRFYYLDVENNQIFIEQHRNYRYDEKTLDTDDPKVIKEDDHTADAFQYMVLDNASLLGLKL